MLQRDYVRCGQQGLPKHRNSSFKKQKKSFLPISLGMIAFVIAILITCIGGLYFTTSHKREEFKEFQDNKKINNNLPSKPKERWIYIKELENRHPNMRMVIESSVSDELKYPDKLTNKQYGLVEQMQTDISHNPKNLNKILWNESIPEQLQQIPQFLSQEQTQKKQLWSHRKQIQKSQSQLYRLLQQKKTQSEKNITQTHQNLLQKNSRSTSKQLSPIIKEKKIDMSGYIGEKQQDERCWVVQCGSFKDIRQAETVRAKLAFEGFDSRVITNNGWNRVTIGPVKGKDNADSTISRLRMASSIDCILLSSDG